jgi:HK97 family phage portal protein
VVDFLAKNIAELRPKVYERDGNNRPEIEDHPLQLLLRSPNPETTDFAHVRNTVADIAIFDRAYWRRYYFRGRLKGILRIPPPSIWPEVDKETGRTVYKLSNGERLTRKDLVIFSGYTPDGMDGGVSPLETLRKLLEEESASTNHRAAYWKNAARQSGWIERPLDAPEWSDVARERFRADMESTMAGAANAGRIGVLEEGMRWNGTAFSPRESEVIESRKLTYEEVCRVYGIPFALIGSMAESKSNVESFHRQLYQDVLAPWLRFLESEIELQLLPDFEESEVRRRRIYVEFNLMAKLAGSFEEQGKTLVTAVGVPYMTANEARARLNLPSIDDEAFDEPVKPLNVLYGGQPAPTVPTEDPGTPPTLVEAASRDAELKAAEERVKHFEERLVKYFELHERDVLSKAGQNGNHRPMFSTSRLWDRDLALRLFNWDPQLEDRADIAKAINDVTYDQLREELEAEGDPKTVFAHAREQRAAQIAQELADKGATSA